MAVRPITITAGDATACCKDDCEETSVVQICLEGEEPRPLCRKHALTVIAWQKHWLREDCLLDLNYLDWMFKYAVEGYL